MLIYMVILVAYGIYDFGPARTLPIALSVIPIGAALDYLLHRLQKTSQTGYPRSGLISVLIVTTLLPLDIGVLSAAAIGILAIASKHFIRTKNVHIFNPAAFGACAGVLLFGIPVGWWADSFAWLALLLGIVNVWRIRKFWQVGSFLASYVLLNLIVNGSFLLQPKHLLVTLPWFFMLFMLPEPKTSLRGKKTEIAFGAVVATATTAYQFVRIISGAPLLFGLLSANLLRIAKIQSAKK